MKPAIHHHPDPATLLAYAAATLTEPLAAVVAAHVAFCPRCRQEVADLELVGAALLGTAAAVDDAAPLTAPKRRSATGGASMIATSHSASERLPGTIASFYGLSLDTVPWRRLAPGVWHHRLALRDPGAGDLRLLRIGAGRAMPEHGHGGEELTLVIEGAYADVTGTYRRGDIQDVGEGVEHRPVVTADAECICLIASERQARFKSLGARLAQSWTRM
jgi:putative transcriptional regulator